MEMILVWNDAKSFKQHLEDMKMFSQSHHNNPQGGFNRLKNMPIYTPNETGECSCFISSRGKPTIVPIWEIELPRGVQN